MDLLDTTAYSPTTIQHDHKQINKSDAIQAWKMLYLMQDYCSGLN